ncbi:class I SAM-dependent methyltransferase [Usitatibacter palustris]|uniref:Class I SAM-dependent methyltransferase n=1 Tax=Usitatibacter palustris TaxID=2732487 RepID=A0A6M4HAC4_9PROT|nr:class I SAM-dependent methyltransferase [Usitatibacter palustris]QJR16501.1 hypothetical protein DSM104440_03336 [Usitatibacter palustris]
MTYDSTIAAAMNFAPPGHFYSPHPLLDDVASGHAAVCQSYENVEGIDLNEAEQLALFRRACESDPVGPWSAEKTAGLRYYYDNFFFRFGDANAVWHIAKSFRPRRVVEVGSGFSTACWLDCIDKLKLECDVHCIEPFPDRLMELCEADVAARKLTLARQPVQDFSPEFFRGLGKGDVLFIDSTHVTKSGSDVNHLVFSVLPQLAPGVLVHFHDIFWPFEYPKEWYLEGRAWNECFLLRAFLQFNTAYRMLRFNSYLGAKHSEVLSAVDPRFAGDSGGSLWLVRQ